MISAMLLDDRAVVYLGEGWLILLNMLSEDRFGRLLKAAINKGLETTKKNR